MLWPAFAESCPSPLLVAEQALLNEKARARRKLAASGGLSRPLVTAPAAPGKRKASAGIPTHLLREVQPDGVKRRVSGKTKPALALLRFAPRKSCARSSMEPPIPKRRLCTKTNLTQNLSACGTVPKEAFESKNSERLDDSQRPLRWWLAVCAPACTARFRPMRVRNQ